MSSSTQIPTHTLGVEPRSTNGALFIGSILAALLFGVTNIQAFIYVRTHTGEWTKFYRLVVLSLWVLDAVQLALTVHCVYYYLVTNFANVNVLVEAVWSFKLQEVTTAIFSSHMDRYFFLTNTFDATDVVNLVRRNRSKVFRVIQGIIIILSSGASITISHVV
ncbi:hypothetical protein BDR04DRAFT_1118760 [Suillus decipiens]|nr:hypothetical protein BDR04DRAFT_1118760 [Suillus decipiens]